MNYARLHECWFFFFWFNENTTVDFTQIQPHPHSPLLSHLPTHLAPSLSPVASTPFFPMCTSSNSKKSKNYGWFTKSTRKGNSPVFALLGIWISTFEVDNDLCVRLYKATRATSSNLIEFLLEMPTMSKLSHQNINQGEKVGKPKWDLILVLENIDVKKPFFTYLWKHECWFKKKNENTSVDLCSMVTLFLVLAFHFVIRLVGLKFPWSSTRCFDLLF